MKKYRALVGLNYPASEKDVALCVAGKPHKRVAREAGEDCPNLPARSVEWLLKDGRIEEVADGDLRVR